jgi:serine/threonine protein kinase
MSGRRPPKGDQIGDWTLVERAKRPSDTIVWFVKDSAGRDGALKRQRPRFTRGGKPTYLTKRFRAEVAGMILLNGELGVLPLLDVDPRPQDREWMVTERAERLADHYGKLPDLRDVVEGFADLATTLARIREMHDIAHRDFKPDNLFWLRNRPHVGDFGIARWPQAESLTGVGGKLGPWGFIAPEALETHKGVDWFAADVYSLAKCLWAIATGRRFPLQGTLFIREEAASLYEHGGQPGLALGRLLELATAHRPYDRPRMRELRDELMLWLDQHPPGSTVRSVRRGRRRVRSTAFSDYYERMVDAGGPERVADHRVHQLLDLLRDRRLTSSEIQSVGGGELKVDLFDVGIHDPDWTAEWVATKSLTWPDYPAIRVIAEGVGGSVDDILYIAQWQVRIGASTWQGTSQIRYRWAKMRLPSDVRTRSELAGVIAADDPD